VLRRLGLIRFGYYGVFVLDFVYRLPANKRYASAHPEVAAPPALRRFETNYDTNLERFIEAGREQAEDLYKLVRPHLSGDSLAVCEWGCGVARLIRHMPRIDPRREVRAYGTDYKADLIRWCRRNIRGVTFELNGLEPPLCFADGQFDWIYSSSVLTHLSPDLQEVWIKENLRVVKSRGIVLFTLHGDAYKHRLIGAERKDYERQGIVVRAGTGAGEPWFTTYNNPICVEKALLKDWDIVDKRLYGEGHMPPRQDIWVVRVA
jgi:SAM-dependent methyltransferase